MSGPHPVVGVAAELADRLGRSSHQTHVAELLDHESEKLVALEERFDLDLHAGILLGEPVGQRLDVLRRDFLVLLLSGDRRHVADDLGRNVHDLADETHAQPGRRQLLGLRHGPETVLQVVVLDGRKSLDRPEAAVVVGEQKSFGRDDLARATAAEDDDRILQRRLVDAVDLLGGEFAPAFLHVSDVHFLKVGQHPHTLVGQGRSRHAQCGEKHKESLHGSEIFLNLVFRYPVLAGSPFAGRRLGMYGRSESGKDRPATRAFHRFRI